MSCGVFPAEMEQGPALPPYFSSHAEDEGPFPNLPSAMLSHLQLVGDFAVSDGPDHSAGLLSSVPKFTKGVCALQRKYVC